jgi:hypothetical protein
MASLFEQVVDCCGLAPAFARKIIAQACERSGVVPEEMGAAELIRALPQIQLALNVFLDPQEVTRKIGAMRGLTRGSWPNLPEVSVPRDDAAGRSPQDPPNTKSTS